VNFSQLTPTLAPLRRFHSILPNLAAIACPSTIPQEQRCHYFLTTLSPKRAHARFKEAAARYQDFHCPKNHKGCPHNMITNRFSRALAPLLTTANIISPTTNLDKETNLHLPTDPTATARPFNVSYKT